MALKHALQIDNLTASFGHITALRNVKATIEPGSVVGIIGPNGGGKTTLIRVLAGSVAPDSGEITYQGARIDRWRTRIAYVPQAREVDWDYPLSAFDVVMMGRYPSIGWFRRPGSDDRARVEWALEQLGLTGLGNRHISQFSGGQQQRIFLARAVAQEPEIVLLDEPMSGLDVTTRETIDAIMRDFAAAGAIVLVATHELDEVQSVCDALICLNRDMIAFGPTHDVFTPAILRQTFGGQLAVFA